MHFDKGKFGAVVIVVSLVLTVVIGYCADVTKVEVERTDYDFITDITGLFDTEQVPEYIDYNPNSNYVGYDGDVVYQASSQPNNYRYVISDGETTSSAFTITRSSNYAKPDAYSGYRGIYLNYTGSTYNMGTPIQTGTGVAYNVGMLPLGVPAGTIASFSTILATSIHNYHNYSSLAIDINQGSWPIWFIPNPQTLQYWETDLGGSNPLQYYTGALTDDNVPTKVIVDTVTLTTTAYRGDTKIWTTDGSTVLCLYGYYAPSYTAGDDEYGRVPINVAFSVSASLPPVYGYADPKGGVSLSSGYSSATWDNGYEIEEVTVLLNQRNWPQQSAINIQFYPYGSYSQNVRVSFFGGGTSVTVYDHQYGESTIIFGTWQGMEIVYNRISGIITATPTGTIRDFTEGPSVRGDTVQITTGWNTGESVPASSEIKFRTGSGVQSPQFGIYSTSVFLNSYGVVMNNPSIDITDYWPDLDQWRLNFYSFALVGDAIRINGVTYPISDSQKITVTDAKGDEHTQTLSNIFITKEISGDEEHTLLTFANDDLTIDLGATVTDVVSFEGLWYFTTGLYNVVQTTGHEYEWNIDGTFNATASQVLVVFLGLLASGVLVGKVALRQEIGILDWALIIGAGAIALAMSGVFF